MLCKNVIIVILSYPTNLPSECCVLKVQALKCMYMIPMCVLPPARRQPHDSAQRPGTKICPGVLCDLQGNFLF